MLTAKIHDRVINVDDFMPPALKKLSNEKQIFCCDCGENLVYRECNERHDHFSHFHSDCSYPFREPESVEHEGGKKSLQKWSMSFFEAKDCVLERKIPETNQRSDLFIEPLRTAVEFQCSVIQENTWHDRHDLYASAGVHDLWILGYSMHRYQSSAHNFSHKINGLERAMFEVYGKIVYFDTLTQHFVFLHPDTVVKGFAIGVEYRFKPEEVSLKDGKLGSRYEYFIASQKHRSHFATGERAKACETERFISESKKETSLFAIRKELASSKQINYIKHLLMQNNKKIPYKFHGILKEEAANLIRKLLSENTA